MRQPVDQLRGFFDAFFQLDQIVWAGFLAGWPGLPGHFSIIISKFVAGPVLHSHYFAGETGNTYHASWSSRFKFCIDLFLKMPNSVRFGIILYSVLFTLEYGPNSLLRSIIPLFGQGISLIIFFVFTYEICIFLNYFLLIFI